jgi:serpin B
MLKNLLLLFSLLACLSLVAQDMADSLNSFAFDTLKLLNTADKNLVFSPYSIYTALAMTVEGAAGETQKEMAATLHHPDGKVLAKMQEILNQSAGEKLQWQVANALWLHNGFDIKKDFMQTLTLDYKSELHQSDFVREPQQSVKDINSWVSDKTNGKIPAIIQELDPLTRLVILNAVYFLGDWQYPFEKEQTKNDKFFLPSGKPVSVPMMQQTRPFNYYDDDLLQSVLLPYQDSQFALLVVLPRDNDLLSLLNSFDEAWLERITRQGTRSDVNLSLPRFKIDYSRGLNDDLKLMGMPLAFSDNADFSSMSKKTKLKIGQVLHRAFIEVNEKGTEVAAATIVQMEMLSAGPSKTTVVFKADHPFLFLLLERKTGAVLFSGIVNDPS